MIVIEGERIKAVGPAREVTIPDGAEVIDLSGATVLPGLIDCHTHLGTRADRYDEIDKFKDTPYHAAFAAVKHARMTLEAGFTTVRDLGSRPFLAVRPPRLDRRGVRRRPAGRRERAGDLDHRRPRRPEQVRPPGPREMYPEERDYRIADGVDQVRHVVRAQLKHGVDVIKVHASGGVLSRGDSPGRPAVHGRGAAGRSRRPTPPAGRSPRTPTGPRGSRTP